MIGWYQEYIIDAGRAGVFWALLAFSVTFALTRGITRHIRAKGERGVDADAAAGEGGLVRDVHIGGVHIHHQVWGILLLLATGTIALAYEPQSPWLEVIGAFFGVGAALTLDEFALWLHLEDVYWSAEGRKSVDAVLLAACIGAALLLGSTPFGVDQEAAAEQGFGGIAAAIALNLGLAMLAIMKGKVSVGLLGLVIPLVALVGAVRLARPGSPWARRFYRDPDKVARAERREATWEGRRERVRDLLGGRAKSPG
ncbi:MAG: hypothetical protein MUE51_09765 [Thermoleophilia bacterium]|nr:hypothetical protein [Thermoleophilia bacterium]